MKKQKETEAKKILKQQKKKAAIEAMNAKAQKAFERFDQVLSGPVEKLCSILGINPSVIG
jgi:hypothetical protein